MNLVEENWESQKLAKKSKSFVDFSNKYVNLIFLTKLNNKEIKSKLIKTSKYWNSSHQKAFMLSTLGVHH